MQFVVTGRVQGVWFRASARQEARRLGVSGWIRNRADGAVEGYAAGDMDSLAGFRDWLGHGPPGAIVINVESQEVDEHDPCEGFTVVS